MARDFKGGQQYAGRLRGYQVPTTFKGIFGQKVEQDVLCFYEARGDQLFFLDVVAIPFDGRMDVTAIALNAKMLYMRLTGKSSMELLLNEQRLI
jgi:hypothetical protein